MLVLYLVFSTEYREQPRQLVFSVVPVEVQNAHCALFFCNHTTSNIVEKRRASIGKGLVTNMVTKLTSFLCVYLSKK